MFLERGSSKNRTAPRLHAYVGAENVNCIHGENTEAAPEQTNRKESSVISQFLNLNFHLAQYFVLGM